MLLNVYGACVILAVITLALVFVRPREVKARRSPVIGQELSPRMPENREDRP